MEPTDRSAAEMGLGMGRGWEAGFSKWDALYESFLTESHLRTDLISSGSYRSQRRLFSRTFAILSSP